MWKIVPIIHTHTHTKKNNFQKVCFGLSCFHNILFSELLSWFSENGDVQSTVCMYLVLADSGIISIYIDGRVRNAMSDEVKEDSYY
ncbi:MAG TPA: hypothetical protein DDE71_08655 [Tenacibaculum sp.]|nr:hypothetical protein [Tenacibaculum sp.]